MLHTYLFIQWKIDIIISSIFIYQINITSAIHKRKIPNPMISLRIRKDPRLVRSNRSRHQTYP